MVGKIREKMSFLIYLEAFCVSGLVDPEVSEDLMQTGTPKMLCCKHGGSRVKKSLWPFCGRIPDPTDTIWASFEC